MTRQADRVRIARIEAGEVDAFAEIVERWQGPLVNLAYRFCRDQGLAEELAQDAFLKIYKSLGQWKGDAAFSTWLFAVATNVYRSWFRRHRPPTVPLDGLERAAADSIQDEAEARDLGRLVREAVLSLPERYRDAMILYYFREMDVREAAEILGVAEGTVKSHLFRGRKMLSDRLPRAAGLDVGGTERRPWTGSIEYSSLKKS